MRYLNKIVFINSAAVKYAEIELDGNVHLIGTQGVGKSTLLRAILFFYNANKTKLGIPREKKSFDDYYFEYQNSYIIYEIVKDGIPFCVLAYKVNGKVAFRFFNAEYKRELFVDANNRAFENWDSIRNAFGRDVHYTKIISSYEEFRKIIYGDNKSLAPEFRKYALIESKQYQNIPRTIQNVLLNSNLEAKFIKDTIINSLNEEEFTIDIENYSKNHLRDFESQINDIKIWFNVNRKGQILVRIQADRIIDKYRTFNFLKREKKALAYDLASRMVYIETEKPSIISDFAKENITFDDLFKMKENLKRLHLKREQDIVSDIKYVTKELIKAKEKQAEYEIRNIHEVIEKVSKKMIIVGEQKTLLDEKNLLTSKFADISLKYEALITQVHNQQQEFYNLQNAEINKIQLEFGDNKTLIYESYQKLITQILAENKEEKEKFVNDFNRIVDDENNVKRKKAELKHQIFFTAEIEKSKEEKTHLETLILNSNSIIFNAKNESETIRKQWELEEKSIVQEVNLQINKNIETQQEFSEKINSIENKIVQSKSSLYGWLNETVPNWEHTIGKVIDEEHVLFNTELNPQLVDENATAIFGVSLNLDAINSRVKTVKEYHQEMDTLKEEISEIQKSITQIDAEKETSLQRLKAKFRKKLNELKEAIAENEYKRSQSEENLKKNGVELDEWIIKSKSEKQALLEKIEHDLEEVASKKLKAQEVLESIEKGISRKISYKETERTKEINILENEKQVKTAAINHSISVHTEELKQRVKTLRKKQTSELDDKGADTKRLDSIEVLMKDIEISLNYITQNETIVIEYNKDKRELFDKVPHFKADKLRLEQKQNTIIDEQSIERNKLDQKYRNQKDVVAKIQIQLNVFEADENKFVEFKKSDAFKSVQVYFSDQMDGVQQLKNAISIISEINDKHYKGIETFKELQQATNAFIGNFEEDNIFRFKVKLNEDSDFLDFASDLKEFIEEDKINQFEKRVNERFAHIIHLIGRETTELNSKEAEIEKIIKKINDDFSNKNFVQAIKEMEMRTQKSSNPVVKLLIEIKEFNDENSLLLGQTNLFTSSDSNSKNQKAVELLKQLIKELEKSKNSTLTLSESFDLQFRIVENDNDSGWVEKLSNVGSEGTDVLVKAMINILLLNVFKDSASKKFKDFKLHCMMDEIGRLHPNNVKGILRFANERNILLINGSPTSQNATDYKYTYKLAKEQSNTDSKKYITKINRLVKVTPKVLN